MKAIGDLRVANDTPLMKVARDFELKYIPSGTDGPDARATAAACATDASHGLRFWISGMGLARSLEAVV
jgi:hypothetical protein